MKGIQHKISASILLTVLAMFAVVGCKRDLSELEPATFPTTAEVFIDGFSAGLNYGAFGGSKVTAFDVDRDVKSKSTASMQVSALDAGDPQRAYAGGAHFASVGRDLTL